MHANCTAASMKHLVLALVFFAVACTPVAPPPSDSRSDVVTLSAERLGPDRIRLILQNGHDGRVGYNLCASALQRWSGSAWEEVRTGDVCTMELRTLPPGQDATYEKELPDDLAAGQYRYVTSVEAPLGTEQRGVASDPFQGN